MAYTLDGDLLQHLYLLRFQRTGRSNHDGFTSMDAQRIEVLHRGHCEAAVVSVADALEFNLLPSLQALLDEDLWGKRKGTLCQLTELLLVGTDT